MTCGREVKYLLVCGELPHGKLRFIFYLLPLNPAFLPSGTQSDLYHSPLFYTHSNPVEGFSHEGHWMTLGFWGLCF